MILAIAQQAATTAASGAAAASQHGLTVMFSHWPAQGELLTWCQNVNGGAAALLVFAGIIYLLFGFQLFKWLITLNAAVLGGALGAVLGQALGAPLMCGLLGAIVIAVVSWPLMKHAVAVMGGIVGALIGASVWRMAGLDGHFAWAGAMTGLAFFGMLAFVLFRGSIMMFTSLQGSAMLIFGLLGLTYKYQAIAPKLTSGMTVNAFIMPVAILIAALIGLVFQQTNSTAASPGAPAKK